METGIEPKLGEWQTQRTRKTRLQRLNPDKSQEQQRKKMTITEELESYIEAGESVLLRGPFDKTKKKNERRTGSRRIY